MKNDALNTFAIHYYGQLQAGSEPSEVASQLGQLFGLSAEKASTLLNQSHYVLKQNLSKEQANVYKAKLEQAGLEVKILGESQESVQEPVQSSDSELSSGISASSDSEREGLTNQANKANTPQSHPILFHGKGGEYFNIWIVNILLTIVTLGFYSPWAKVRNKQYFYGNTEINGATFQYHALPMQILKGRLIAVAFFALYALLQAVSPELGVVLGLLFLPLTPWLVIKSLAFNLRYTSFRNVRFNHKATYGEAVKVFVLIPLLVIVTLGLAIPYLWYRQSKLVVDNAYFGTSKFDFKATPKAYFMIFLFTAGISLGLAAAFFIVSTILGTILSLTGLPQEAMSGISAGALLAAYLVIYIWAIAYVKVATWNLYFNQSEIEGNGFEANMKTKPMIWIYTTNTLLIVLTLGFYIPWAQVKMANFRASCLAVNAADMDQFIDGEQEKISSLGEEVGDVFDIDFSPI